MPIAYRDCYSHSRAPSRFHFPERIALPEHDKDGPKTVHYHDVDNDTIAHSLQCVLAV